MYHAHILKKTFNCLSKVKIVIFNCLFNLLHLWYFYLHASKVKSTPSSKTNLFIIYLFLFLHISASACFACFSFSSSSSMAWMKSMATE